VGFFKRLFSADYRAAVSAEAAGDLELAAERYALAGQIPAAVRVHLARASRAETRADEIAALYDALHWAERDTPCYVKAARALGRALLARARAEGIATPRDAERVREAAWLLSEAGDFEAAADALQTIGDERAAAEAYRRGGLVEKMEELLAREEQEAEVDRALRESFAQYELSYRGGQRDAARAALEACVELAADKAEYRRLLDELESRLITGRQVTLKPRRGARVAISARDTVWIGRDPLSDLALRSAGVSRRHARVERRADDAGASTYTLRDAGSRAGTQLAGLPIAGAMPLHGSGEIRLGDTTLAFEVADAGSLRGALVALEVVAGLDAGARLLCVPEDAPIALADMGLDATLVLRDGRPLIRGHGDAPITLNGERIAQGEAQLLRGDLVGIAGEEVEVA
jgi:tetratricopeptide (TPR) repeat protein